MPVQNVHPDLARERQLATFDTGRMALEIYGQKHLDDLARVQSIISNIPELDCPIPPDMMSTEERYAEAARKTVILVKYAHLVDSSDIEELDRVRRLIFLTEVSPLQLHYVMFLPALMAQATDEQIGKWLPLVLAHRVIGCYGQTEMGHGTDLRKLETTATYDPASEEFVLNSPSLTSTKWWPGNCGIDVGKSSNFSLVMAQLYTRGQCHGVHMFLVQLRTFDTHMPLPGITVGDIGPKLGNFSNDNGFLRMNNVRIPRDQMLMRHSKVLSDGTYVAPPHKKLAYSTMMGVRTGIVANMGNMLMRASTIAVRYSAVRRQGEIQPGAGEVQIIDYATQQYKLFGPIANAFAFFFTSKQLVQSWRQVSGELSTGNVDRLAETHVILAGLKAFATWEANRSIEICRLACGGHGYSLSSGLYQLFAETTASITYEGENTVMLLQTARAIVKAFRQKDAAVLRYLEKTTPSSLDQRLLPSHLFDAYEAVALRQLAFAVETIDRLTATGQTAEQAWNKTGNYLCRASKAHIHQYVVRHFFASVDAVEDGDCRNALKDVALYYALWGIERSPGKFLSNSVLTPQQITLVSDHLHGHLLPALRGNAVALVDSFQISDRALQSVLGRFDGRVYEALWDWAQKSPLNKKQVLDCHASTIGRLIAGDVTIQSKL